MKFSITNTKKFVTLSLLAMFASTALFFFGYTQKTEAGGGGGTKSEKTKAVDRSSGAKVKSTKWNKAFNMSLKHDTPQNALRGWLEGVRDPNVTIMYFAQVIDTETGKPIPDGSTIPVGTKVRIERLTYKNTDIAWFGTGFASDSPYGNWLSKAARPTWACKSSDFLVSDYANILRGNVRIYAPLNVNPPTVSYSMGGTAKVTQNPNKANVFTVNSTGTIKPKITFASTYGKFYYQWKDGGNCNVVPKAMRRSSDMSTAYVMSVPVRSIAFSFTVENPGQPPNPPTITGPRILTVGQTGTYNFKATDPDGDRIRYKIDWNDDRSVDAFRPADQSYIASGASRNGKRTWNTPGTYTFNARTQDNTSMQSGWASYTVTVVDAVQIASCGPNPSSINQGQSASWSASVSGGSGSYSYEWVGTEDLYSTKRNVNNWTYYTAGDHGAVLSVTDNGDGSIDTLTCDVLEVVGNGAPQCSDGMDNDGDGLVDMADPDCTDPNDDNEFPEYVPECSDGIDNDGNGDIDYPDDPDCSNPDDDDEGVPVSMTPIACPLIPTGDTKVVDFARIWPITSNGANSEVTQARPITLDPGVYVVRAVSWDGHVGRETNVQPYERYYVSLYNGVTDVGAEVGQTSETGELADGVEQDSFNGIVDSSLTIASPVTHARGTHAAYPDTNANSLFPICASFTPVTGGTQCSDGIDNDGNGDIDMADPDCTDPSDDDEGVPAGIISQCSDGVDNDGDGYTDFGGSNPDPGCTDASDDDETDTVLPQCSDGVDNDGDGYTDFGGSNPDPGCTDASDDDETDTDCGLDFELIAEPDYIVLGDEVTLTWNLGTCAAAAASCTLEGSGINLTSLPSGTTGSDTAIPTGSATYTLTCPLDDDTASVEVEQSGQET